MKISYRWLSDYLPKQTTPEKLSQILTGIGLEVEETEQIDAVPGNLEGLVVGQVMSCEKHPDSDHLKVTNVQIDNDKTLSIVCGAPNVAAGQKVIVATVGTTLYPKNKEPFQIKKAKLRGVPSKGMICAEDEIGMGDSHDGIMILPENTPVGLSAAEYFKIPPPEIVFNIGLTPNRSDANSHLGVAKDLCAYWSYHEQKDIRPLLPDISGNIDRTRATESLPIEISVENKEACPRYAGLVISGIQVKPSPDWLQKKLLSVGIHPINNVVDVTNFVLQEYGQPLHAFDYDKIKGHQIRVKNLSKNTPFRTLDDVERKLSDEDLMICDADGAPLCMAGVFGGIDSGISNDTKNIFIESAYFHPKTIRRSSLRHQLRTDAALHFEKGVDMKNIIPALKRAAGLILDMTAGKIASDLIDDYPTPKGNRPIALSYDYLEKICGKSFKAEAVTTLFQALGFSVSGVTENGLMVHIPEENQDIFQPADLAEEVLRIDGLDNVPMAGRLSYTLSKTHVGRDFRQFKERIAEYLAYAGFQEIVTNSITNSGFYPEENHLVKLMNSLSIELDILRPKMQESGLQVIAYNQNRKMDDVHIFEMGKTYADYGEHRFEQTEWLSIWTTGNIRPKHWSEAENPSDIFVLKGLISAIFALVGLKKIQEESGNGFIVWKRGQQEIARLTNVSEEHKKTFGLKSEVYFANIRLANLFEAIKKNAVQHRDTPKYPAMKRDLAIIVPKKVGYQELAQVVKKQKWSALQGFELFDIFEHEKIGKDNKSLALSFTFQLTDRTMTDKEVDDMMSSLITAYENQLGATIRH